MDPQNITLRPEQEMTVLLTVAKWEQVLSMIGEAPYRLAAPLIGEIRTQIMNAATEAAIAAESRVMPASTAIANGAAGPPAIIDGAAPP